MFENSGIAVSPVLNYRIVTEKRNLSANNRTLERDVA